MKKLLRITTIPLSLDKLLGNQLTFMNQFYEITAVSSDPEELERVAQKYGVKFYPVDMTRTISPLKDLVSLWKLYQFLRREKPHIVHSHTPKAGIVGMMAAYFAGVPNRFHTVAGLPLLEANGLKRILLNAVEKLTYYFATKVYPNSFELQKIILKENFCASEKLKVIGKGSSNGIDTTYFNRSQISRTENEQLKAQLGISEDDFVFIFLGRLVRDKGINELITAFKNLNLNLNLNLKLLLVGPLENNLDPLEEETLQEIETNPQIITTGFQEEVRPYYAVSDALVFPSYREGFPNVVLQSLAMELPAIVTDINGCNEIITDGENGLIIPVKDAVSLQTAMEKLLLDSILYGRLKLNSRESIAPYEQQVVWQALLAEYRGVEEMR